MSTFQLPIFPLPDLLFFPGTFLPLHIFEPRYRSLLAFALENGREIGIAPIWKENLSLIPEPIEPIFGWGHIIQEEPLPDGRSNIILEGLGVCELKEYISMKPFRIGKVEKLPQDKSYLKTSEYKGRLQELIVLTKRILLSEGASDELILKMNLIANHPFAIDFVTSLLNYNPKEKQKVLQAKSGKEKTDTLKMILMSLNLME